jgi:hypothetical protein
MLPPETYHPRSSGFSRLAGARTPRAQTDGATARAGLGNSDAVNVETMRGSMPSAGATPAGLGSCVDVLKVRDCCNEMCAIAMGGG